MLKNIIMLNKKFFVKKGVMPMEIHHEMVNVLGDAEPLKTIVCKWALEFKHRHYKH